MIPNKPLYSPRATRPLPRRCVSRARSLSPIAAAVVAALHGAGAPAAEAAPAATPTAQVASTAASASDDATVAEAGLQSITVTATRRAATAQEIPLSITAISGNSLESAGIDDVGKLAQTLAGVDFTDKGPFSGVAGANLIIRGLNSEATAWLPGAATPVVPSVATYVDDTPLFVNLRLQDLDRVEVLRGPQGTLYGSGSLGGTIRFVQNAPDPSGFDAKAQAGISDTVHTVKPNEEVSGMLNIPFGDTLAVRLNAGWSYDAGFINQPNLYRLDASGVPVSATPGDVFGSPVTYAQNHTNDYQYRSARVSALWKPADAFRAQLSYYYQYGTAGGFPYVATTPLAYTQPIAASHLPSGTFDPPAVAQLYPASVPQGADRYSNADNFTDTTQDRVDLAALDLSFDFGFATLSSSSSFAHHYDSSAVDETAEYINFGFNQSLYGQNPREFVTGNEALDDRAWAQEFRLVSKAGTWFDWLVGAFYRDDKTHILEQDWYPGYTDFFNGCSPLYGASNGDGVTPSQCGIGVVYTPGPTQYVVGVPIVKDEVYINTIDTHFKDLAGFGEITFHLTSSWNLTGGARVFKQTVSQTQVNALVFDGPEYAAAQSLSDEWRRALWKVNTAYHLDENNLVYATWSQGFRRGGVNALPPSELGGSYVTNPQLAHISPDTADNYELGAKGTIERRLQYSAAVYDIEWRNIEEGVDLTPLVLPGALNIGNGYSRGIELELDALIGDHLTTHVGYTYDKTKLTSLNPLFTEPNTSIPPPPTGGPLPGTPKSSVVIGLTYAGVSLLGGDWTWGFNAHYQSAVLPALSATVPTVPGFTLLDTRLSYERSHWLASVYCNNITNNLGITAYQDPALFGNRAQAVISTPRTIGLTLAYALKEH